MARISTTPFQHPHLDDCVARVRLMGYRFVKFATRATGELMGQEDFRHHVNAAVWSAYCARAGDTTPQDFDWTQQVARRGAEIPVTEALVTEALTLLREDLLGSGSSYGDLRMRVSSRSNRAMVEAYQWTAWQAGGAALPEGRTPGLRRQCGQPELLTDYTYPLEQEQQFEHKQLGTVVDVLRDALSERDFKWLVERYARGVTLYEQIEAVVTSDPAYTGPHGLDFWRKCQHDAHNKVKRTDEGFVEYRRVERLINVAVYRAKAKARKALGDTWGEVARAVAA